LEIVGQFLMAAGQMGVGNLGQAKFGHGRDPSGPMIHGLRSRKNDEFVTSAT
jgi:hypothetical protein